VLDTQATCVQLIDAATLKVSMSTICQFYSDYDLQQLGADRWLQMLGAACLYPDKPFILWQAGTAQTIDWVSNDCNSSIIHHQQGWIVLGIATYLKALHDYTGQLPHLELTEVIETLSRNTSDLAITTQAAITTGLTHYLRGLIMQIYQCSPPTSSWLVTGGDRQIIAHMIQHLQQSGYLPITLSLHMVDMPLALYGLAHIAHHHLQHAVV
jgi:pantothenate kinase type III